MFVGTWHWQRHGFDMTQERGLESGMLTEGTELEIRQQEGTAVSSAFCILSLHCVVLIQCQGAETFWSSQQVLWRPINSPHFISTECSLQHSQEPLTCPSAKEINPLHASSSQLNIILPSTPRLSKWSLSLSCPHQNPAWKPVFHTCYMTHLSNYFWLVHHNNIYWRI